MLSPAAAIFMIIVTGVLLAGMDAIGKLLAQGAPVLFVLWGRYFFHAAATFAVTVAKRRNLGFLKARRPGLQFIRASALFGATTCLYTSLQYMPLGDASAIQFMAPVLITLIAGLFLGEAVGPRRYAAVVVAFVGVLVVARPGSGVFGWVALLPFATACLLAIYMIMTRTIRDKDDPASTTFYSTAVGALALTLALPVTYQPLSTNEWILMVTMGSAGAAGHFLLVRAFHSAEASLLAPFTYAQVLAALVWGYLIFGDVPSAWTATGAALIIGSGLYVWHREQQTQRV